MSVVLSRKKKVLFALITMVFVMTGGLGAMLAADLVLHHRAERSAGLNRWGYRGPVLPRKRPGEIRIVMLGGSTVFGYGVTWQEAIPALLERQLNQRQPDRAWTVVNLGYNSEGAFAFLPNLRDFAYLDYDIVVLYEGYNDMLGDNSPNYVAVRQRSPVFRSTGYFPILPLWLEEKSLAIRSGGLTQGYTARMDQQQRTVFKPSLAARASASALEAAASVTGALERQFQGAAAGEGRNIGKPPAGTECPSPWSHYCEAQRRAIQYALDHGKRVLVVSQPFHPSATVRARHEEQQRALLGMMTTVYAASPSVAHFAVGDRVDLASTDLSFDQMHLNPDGNRLVAEALAVPVIELWSKR